MNDQPVLPTYMGPNIRGLIPALVGPTYAPLPSWMPSLAAAPRRVLLVVDGLGWDQLTERWALAPTLASMEATTITTVAPSTTATALTSITTGLTPGEHGLIGYRIDVGRDVLNVLRWRNESADLRRVHQPRSL
ncbi:MAG TPA: alkaline phosphatase family protein, partial [Ilumatobacteraceae bacterium]|nr:alkaline phosphatase family protein [Ilumatobacteraceae bacterium]